jgi:hemerythrin-like domain-containing protein
MSAATDPDLTMNRVIHAAVRRDLARLEGALAAFPAGDAARAADLDRAYTHLEAELTRHHEGEDRWVFPMLAGVGAAPDLLAAMEDEHLAMQESLVALGRAMEGLVADPGRDSAERAHASVVAAREVVEHHLTHEETDLEPVLRPHLGSAEWKAAEKQLRRASPSVAGEFFAWLQDGMEESHRAFLRRSVPAPVTFVLGRVFGRAYHRDVAPVWRAG